MFLQPYEPHELSTAYCYRVYLRWRTHRCRPYPELIKLDRSIADSLVKPYNIRVLTCETDSSDLLAIVSLQPSESISSCAIKFKGQVSKWLRAALQLDHPTDLLSKGYFAYTVGNSRRRAIERYLDQQATHHGYDRRILPPVFVEQYQLTAQDQMRITPKHAAVVSQFHAVLATSWRKGIIGSQDGQRIASSWLALSDKLRISLIKVSFVPDHVHFAFRTHPMVAPIDVVVALMNSAQEIMSRSLIAARVDRLWQPSCYIGSYGDLASSQVRKYIESWSKRN